MSHHSNPAFRSDCALLHPVSRFLWALLLLVALSPRLLPATTYTAPGPVVINEFQAAGSSYNLNWDSGHPRLGPGPAWQDPAFDDSAWPTGPGGFGYGDPGLGTTVPIQGQSYSFYLRKSFPAPSALDNSDTLELSIDYDDGFVAYINGVEVARRAMGTAGGIIYHNQPAYQPHEAGTPEVISLGSITKFLHAGANVLAIQVSNESLGSDDLSLTADLRRNHAGTLTPLVVHGEAWRYFVGVSEPSGGLSGAPDYQLGPWMTTWTRLGYDDSFWRSGPGPIGYGDGIQATDLTSDLVNMATTLYLRHPFTIGPADASLTNNLDLQVDYDDAFVAYLNGVEVARANVGTAGDPVPYTAIASSTHEIGAPQTFHLGQAQTLLRQGANVLAIQLVNTRSDSSDLSLIANLTLTGATSEPLVRSSDTWNYYIGSREPSGQGSVGPGASDLEASQLNFDFVDWIELANTSQAPVALDGWSLTDDETDPGKWVFPNGITLAPGQFLVVYADGLDRRTTDTQHLHTNFKLSSTGGYLALFNDASPRAAATRFDGGYPAQSNFYTYGRYGQSGSGAGADYQFLGQMTPGKANTGPAWPDILPPPQFNGTPNSAQHGLYDTTVTLTLTQPTPGAQIRYTLDGTEPTSTTGQLYQQPLTFTTNAALRARAFLDGHISSPTVTQTYLFQVLAGSDLSLMVTYYPNKPEILINTDDPTNYPYAPAPGGRIGQTFLARAPFTAVASCNPTWNTSTSSCRQSLRKDGPAGAIIATRVITNAVDNAWNTLSFTLQPAGRYFLEISEVNGQVGWWGPQRDIYPGGAAVLSGLSDAVALHSMPALSVTGDASANLIEPYGIMAISGGQRPDGRWIPAGINDYDNALLHGRIIERPVNFEYLPAAGGPGFAAPGGIRMGRSDVQRPGFQRQDGVWTNPSYKWAFRTYFRSDYGCKSVDYPVFGDWPSDVSPAAGTPPDPLKVLSVRSGNDWCNPFILDEFTRRSHAAMGQLAARGSFINMFMNGQFKGYYNFTDRLDEEFFQEAFHSAQPWDIHKAQVNLQFQYIVELVSGNFQAWDLLNLYATHHDLTVKANYDEICRRMDMTSFIDFLLVNLYAGNADWPWNNWIAAREHVPGAPFRFYIWDADLTFLKDPGVTWRTIDKLENEPNDIPVLYRALKNNADFRRLWQDRVQKHFLTPGGALTQAKLLPRLKALQAMVEPMIQYQFNQAFDTFIETQWIPNRQSAMLDQFTSSGFWPPALQAPAISRAPGVVDKGVTLTMTNPNGAGTIYFTTNGADPRNPGTGALVTSATVYLSPVKLDRSLSIKARVYNGTTWSPLTDTSYRIIQTAVAPGALIVSEIFANASGNDDNREWFELYNTTSDAIDINGWEIRDNGTDRHTINNGGPLIVPAHSYLVLGQSKDTSLNGGAPVDYAYGADITLGNSGDELILLQNGTVIHSVGYGAYSGQPLPLMIRLNLTPSAGTAIGMGQDYAHGPANYWRAQTSLFGDGDKGTPGKDNDGVVVGAGDTVAPHLTAARLARRDLALVLFDEPVDPASALVAAHYMFGGGAADPITRVDAAADPARVLLTLSAPLQPGVTYTLTVTGVKDTAGNAMNAQQATLGYLTPPVVINEIMYHDRGTTNTEWIELHNTTDAPVDISGWSLSNDPDSGVGTVTLPANTVLTANEYAVINLWGNPAFRNRWRFPPFDGRPDGVRVIDPVASVAGSLGNSGDILALSNAANGGRLIDGSLAVRYPDLCHDGQSLEKIDELIGWGDADTAPYQWRAATVSLGIRPALAESGLPLSSQASPGRANNTPSQTAASDWTAYP